MTKEELMTAAVSFAKEKYGENLYAGLWGSASVFLTEKELRTIIEVMQK